MADQFDPNGKASFLSASVSDEGKRKRERGTCTSGWRRHTAPSETNVSTNVKTRGEEAEERRRKGWRTRTTRFTTVQLDRAFTSFPFLNACVCVSTYRNGIYSDADRLPHRQVETESYEGKVRPPSSASRGRGSRIHVGLRKS